MRADMYSPIHKALRSLLFHTAGQVAKTDFADEAQACAAATAVRTMVDFLREHGHHEDQVVMPVLLASAPELTRSLALQHAALDEAAHGLDVLVAQLDAATTAERPALGKALDRKVSLLVAGHLEHMNREETEANQALWATCTDAELGAMSGRIQASIAPDRMREWLVWLAPTLSAADRAAMAARQAS